jgi:hypothetical protein
MWPTPTQPEPQFLIDVRRAIEAWGGDKSGYRRIGERAAAAALPAAAAAVAAVSVFSYTGSLQTYVIPVTGDWFLEAVGAQGGSGNTSRRHRRLRRASRRLSLSDCGHPSGYRRWRRRLDRRFRRLFRRRRRRRQLHLHGGSRALDLGALGPRLRRPRLCRLSQVDPAVGCSRRSSKGPRTGVQGSNLRPSRELKEPRRSQRGFFLAPRWEPPRMECRSCRVPADRLPRRPDTQGRRPTRRSSRRPKTLAAATHAAENVNRPFPVHQR